MRRLIAILLGALAIALAAQLLAAWVWRQWPVVSASARQKHVSPQA